MLSVNATSKKPISIDDVPSGFDPDIAGAGLVLNLDASVISSITKSANGTTVTTWTDQKNSLVATSQANTSTYQINGVKLDGIDYFSIPAAAALNLSSAMSIFVVATVDDVTTNSNGSFVSHSSGTTGYQFRYTTPPDGKARFNLAGVIDADAAVTSWESGVRACIGVVFGGGSYEYQKNGAQLGSPKASGSGNPANVATLIGAAEGTGEKLVGTIHQILIYNTKLAGADLSAVQQGLLSKWVG